MFPSSKFIVLDKPIISAVFPDTQFLCAKAIATLAKENAIALPFSAELSDRMGMKVKHPPQGML